MSRWLVDYGEAYPYSEVVEATDIYKAIVDDEFTGDVDDIESITKLED